MMRGHRPGHVAACMQMRDVEGRGRPLQIALEAEWKKQLPVVRAVVREVRKHLQGDAVGRPGRGPSSQALARRVGSQARPFVAGVGRDDRHVMTESGEPSREGVGQPGYAAVRPGVRRIRRHVKNAERSHALAGHGQLFD